MKALVVFYSRTGSTKRAARTIKQKLQCDIEEIVSEKNRGGFFGFMKCGFEATFKKTPAIKETKTDPSSYDVVVIGTPIWVGTMSSPVRTYISQNKEYFKEVAFFCVYASSGSDKTFEGMEGVCGKTPVALLGLTGDEVDKEDYTEKIEKFSDKIVSYVKKT